MHMSEMMRSGSVNLRIEILNPSLMGETGLLSRMVMEGKSTTLSWRKKYYDRQISGRKNKRLENEIERWIEKDILLPWKEEVES